MSLILLDIVVFQKIFFCCFRAVQNVPISDCNGTEKRLLQNGYEAVIKIKKISWIFVCKIK
jgi:hypothetical protein